MNKLITTVLLLIGAPARAAIVYDVTFAGLSAQSASGVGVVTFVDAAFDVDGAFNSAAGVADIDVVLDGFPFDLANMVFSAQVDYQVQGGALTGFDWNADAGFASLSRGIGRGDDGESDWLDGESLLAVCAVSGRQL